MTRPYLLAATDSSPSRRFYDVIVIGSGIGGLTAAVGAARKWKVALITKSVLRDTTTFLAQGGIAAALSEQDSADLHFEDTIRAGAGLCREEAVRILVEEGPLRVRELMEICPKFDRAGDDLVLASEGAHTVPRIVHAGGDATGMQVTSALAEAMRHGSRVQVLENEFVVDLLTNGGRCIGAVSLDLRTGDFTLNFATATVLATGGSGQIYSLTTNPRIATGDGMAMAWRAGAAIGDMEFVQFHPTGLYSDESPIFLITEALRGEGAYLLNHAGERFMVGVDPRAELGPRDVVVKEMVRQMQDAGKDFLFLDATHLDCDMLRQRFPNVSETLREKGYDLCHDKIPIAPVCHYMIGGIVTDVWGRSTLPGLYASGEVANTGVHGANRLASNSLLEGLVFSDRIVRDLDRYIVDMEELVRRLEIDLPGPSRKGNRPEEIAGGRRHLQTMMSRYVGTVRSEDGMLTALEELRRLHSSLQAPRADLEEYELFNLLTVSVHVVRAALLRQESRGAHLREDFPETDDANWKHHINFRLREAEDERKRSPLLEG
ncbi:MAG: L-aspartate oxidase [Thermoleophilia bacterium]|nr:L-aspartate oxidase [Thermoleophilia bacterium]